MSRSSVCRKTPQGSKALGPTGRPGAPRQALLGREKMRAVLRAESESGPAWFKSLSPPMVAVWLRTRDLLFRASVF